MGVGGGVVVAGCFLWNPGRPVEGPIVVVVVVVVPPPPSLPPPMRSSCSLWVLRYATADSMSREGSEARANSASHRASQSPLGSTSDRALLSRGQMVSVGSAPMPSK